MVLVLSTFSNNTTFFNQLECETRNRERYNPLAPHYSSYLSHCCVGGYPYAYVHVKGIVAVKH